MRYENFTVCKQNIYVILHDDFIPKFVNVRESVYHIVRFSDLKGHWFPLTRLTRY